MNTIGKIKLIPLLLLIIFIYSCKSENDITLEEQTQSRSIKRGVSYGFQLPDIDTELLSPGVSWFYNWAPDVSSSLDAAASNEKLDFYPMAWNGNFDANKIRAYKQLHPECMYILAFNEPNLTDQANMTPQQAASAWVSLKALADELQMKLISPAMNYGTLSGYGDPIVWLDEFFKLVPLSDVDGIAIHCYMSSPGAMASYVRRFKKYGKPIWMTEFCAWEKNVTSVKVQMNYMSDAVNFLECNKDVARYAWFIPRSSGALESYPYMQLLTKTQPYDLSDLGKVYINMSTLDKNIYYAENQVIQAEHYTSLNMEEAVNNGGFENSIHLRPTTDADGVLDVCDFYINLWLEYQIEVTKTQQYNLALRYASQFDTKCEISIDGNVIQTVDIPNTDSESNWQTSYTKLNINKGKHTLKLKITDGGIALNWLKISKN
ncbi:Glycoside hydrolase family 16 domain protein [uncultured Paludibacter sp.]|uniref:Glycoside hydrolase family 16 domain protein n=1 Tax=uncultured Paludibacter sp. TaxID=497635 RepID=A0A653AL26_9BACT|nr:Glycoside hydrolase family 16 domain protein [uncultured Paludibacter sp.]